MAEVKFDYDTAGNYTKDATIRVYNSYAQLIGHQDSSASPATNTNNGADDGGAGEFDQCLHFVKANSDYMTVSPLTKMPLLQTDNITIECWVKTSYTADHQNLVFFHRQNNYPLLGIEVGKTTGYAKFVMKDASGNVAVVTGTTNLCDGSWHHIAGVRNRTTDKNEIYADGTREASVTDTTTDNFNTPTMLLYISGRYGGTNPAYELDGYIDEVRISDSVRYNGATYTVPTSEFVADANTVYLNHLEDSTAHSTSDPAIYKTTGDNINVGSWTSFAEDAEKYGTDAEIKYQLYNGSNYQYWNGSAWTNSNGTYAQSSTASDINTNISSFTTGSITGFNIKALLHADAADTPILDSVTATYSESAGATVFLNTNTKFWGP
jgi:hypothetical protein